MLFYHAISFFIHDLKLQGETYELPTMTRLKFFKYTKI